MDDDDAAEGWDVADKGAATEDDTAGPVAAALAEPADDAAFIAIGMRERRRFLSCRRDAVFDDVVWSSSVTSSTWPCQL